MEELMFHQVTTAGAYQLQCLPVWLSDCNVRETSNGQQQENSRPKEGGTRVVVNPGSNPAKGE